MYSSPFRSLYGAKFLKTDGSDLRRRAAINGHLLKERRETYQNNVTLTINFRARQQECVPMSAPRFAARVAQVAPFEVMAVLAQAIELDRQGRDVVHLEVGEPDFPTAAPIVAAAHAAIDAGATKYTAALGLLALREAICDYYLRYYGLTIPVERIVITAGATGGLLLLSALLMDPGDGLLMTDPGYPCNRNFMQLFAAEAQAMPVDATANYQPDAAVLGAAWRENTRGVLLASPANPTGAVLTDMQLRDLAQVCRERDGFVIVDEIYQGLTFPDDARMPCPGHGNTGLAGVSGTALSTVPDAYVINSFSKYFGMTGWRLGWIVAPQAAVPALERLAQNFVIAPSTIAQHAAIAALSPECVAIHEVRREELRARRDYLGVALRELGFGLSHLPQGAFYLYADIAALGTDSRVFCQRALLEAGVAITPGYDFGDFRAAEHVRFACTSPIPRLREAVGRLATMLGRAT